MSSPPKTEKKDADEVEDEVLARIPTLTAVELEEVCGVIKLAIPDERKGNKRELRKLLTNDLMKDSEDSNLATLLMIHDHSRHQRRTEEQTQQGAP